MIRTLVEKELKNNLLSLRFVFALLIILVVMLGSAPVRIDDYLQSTLDARANATAERQAHENSHFWRFQWIGMCLERPVLPLSVFVTGTERNPDPRFRVFQKAKPIIRASGAIDRNPLVALSTPIDLMFITGIVMSLLVLVLSFDSVAGEREDGTLKLLLSFPISRSVFIFAKWLGGLLTLAIPFLIGYLCLALWIVLDGRVQLSGADWGAYALMGVASLLYIAWMFSAALMVSCWCRQAATAMCLLLLFWVLLVLVIPNATPYLAAALKPADSSQSVQFNSMKKVKELQNQEKQELDALAKKYNNDRWWRNEDAWREGILIVARIHDLQRQATRSIGDRYDAQVLAQTELAQALGRISPFASYAHMVSQLAWTGPAFERHLDRLMREYEDQLRRMTTDGLLDQSPFLPEAIPYFRYAPPPLAQRFMAGFMDWVLLATGSIVFFLGAYVSFVTREIV